MTPDERHKHRVRRVLVWPELGEMSDEELLRHLTYNQAPLRRQVLKDEVEYRGLDNTR